MHYPGLSLPDGIAAGVTRSIELAVDKITTVGGWEVRNQEWDVPLRTYEVPFPNMKSSDPDFLAVHDLWKAVNGEADSFVFFDELDNEQVPVRFEGQLKASHVAGPWWTIETIMLIEVRIP